MKHWRFVYRYGGGHVHVDVRVADFADATYGLCGTIVMTRVEFEDFKRQWGTNRFAKFVDAQLQALHYEDN